jgi:hypothetical protein
VGVSVVLVLLGGLVGVLLVGVSVVLVLLGGLVGVLLVGVSAVSPEGVRERGASLAGGRRIRGGGRCVGRPLGVAGTMSVEGVPGRIDPAVANATSTLQRCAACRFWNRKKLLAATTSSETTSFRNGTEYCATRVLITTRASQRIHQVRNHSMNETTIAPKRNTLVMTTKEDTNNEGCGPRDLSREERNAPREETIESAVRADSTLPTEALPGERRREPRDATPGAGVRTGDRTSSPGGCIDRRPRRREPRVLASRLNRQSRRR